MREPHLSYQNLAVAGKNQLELMLILYDGAIGFLRKARPCIREQRIEEAHDHLMKAKRIVGHLCTTLDLPNVPPEGEELVGSLHQLYMFCYERIGMANLKKDEADLDAALNVLEMLREGWSELEESGEWQPEPAPPVFDKPTINIAEA